MKIVRKVLKISTSQLNFTLSGLRGNTLFSCLSFRAVNNFGIESDAVTCDNITTNVLSKKNTILSEIDRVKKSEDEFIDSDFFHKGVLQREDKITYLRKLGILLDHINSSSSSVSKMHGQTADVLSPIHKETDSKRYDSCKCDSIFEQRKCQFSFRINSLKEEIRKFNIEIENDQARISLLLFQIKQIQERVVFVQVELSHLGSRSNLKMTSCVIHNSDQKFIVSELKENLNDELIDLISSIETKKAEIINVKMIDQRLKNQILVNEDYLNERVIAQKIFLEKINGASKLRLCVSIQLNDIKLHCLTKWRSISSKHRGIKRIKAIFEKNNTVFLKFAFKTWMQFKGRDINNFNDTVFSRGGKMLLDVENLQKGNISYTLDILKDVSSGAIIDEVEEKQIKTCSKLFKFLLTQENIYRLKGDFYFDIGNISKAMSCYEYLLSSLRRLSYDEIAQNQCGLCFCIIYVKFCKLNMMESKFNVAILHLERLLSFARGMNEKYFIAHTMLLVGECYLQTGHDTIAQEYLTDAVSQFHNMNNKEQESRACMLLHLCYELKGNDLKSALNLQRCNNLMYGKNNNTIDTLEKMQSLKNRLINITASIY